MCHRCLRRCQAHTALSGRASRARQPRGFAFKQETQKVPLLVGSTKVTVWGTARPQPQQGSRAPALIPASRNKRWKGLCPGQGACRGTVKRSISSPRRKGTAFFARTRCFPSARAESATTHLAEAESYPFISAPRGPAGVHRAESLHGMRHGLGQIRTRPVWKPWRQQKHIPDGQLPAAPNLFDQRQRDTGSTRKTCFKRSLFPSSKLCDAEAVMPFLRAPECPLSQSGDSLALPRCACRGAHSTRGTRYTPHADASCIWYLQG